MLPQTIDVIELAQQQGLEYKMDGARVQVHRSGSDVRVFTRRLNDVTAAVPELGGTGRVHDWRVSFEIVWARVVPSASILVRVLSSSMSPFTPNIS